LAVFAGGWTLEAAEAVCGDCAGTHAVGGGSADGGRETADDRRRAPTEWALAEEPSVVRRPSSVVPSIRKPQSPIRNEEVLELLASLVEKSLALHEEEHGDRYRLLETVRQYGWERLREAEEAAAARCRHLSYFLGLAEAASAELTGPDQATWLERLEA